METGKYFHDIPGKKTDSTLLRIPGSFTLHTTVPRNGYGRLSGSRFFNDGTTKAILQHTSGRKWETSGHEKTAEGHNHPRIHVPIPMPIPATSQNCRIFTPKHALPSLPALSFFRLLRYLTPHAYFGIHGNGHGFHRNPVHHSYSHFREVFRSLKPERSCPPS